MSKLLASILDGVESFIIESMNCIAPYTVINSEMRKQHFCWTFSGALEWIACYDAQIFGSTSVMNFNGEIIAQKGN